MLRALKLIQLINDAPLLHLSLIILTLIICRLSWFVSPGLVALNDGGYRCSWSCLPVTTHSPLLPTLVSQFSFCGCQISIDVDGFLNCTVPTMAQLQLLTIAVHGQPLQMVIVPINVLSGHSMVYRSWYMHFRQCVVLWRDMFRIGSEIGLDQH